MNSDKISCSLIGAKIKSFAKQKRNINSVHEIAVLFFPLLRWVRRPFDAHHRISIINLFLPTHFSHEKQSNLNLQPR